MFGGLSLIGRIQKLLKEQRQWIAECGGDLNGYRQRYGHRRAAEIYAADVAELQRVEARLNGHLCHLPRGRRGQ
jgi:hypothetical protein